jgi:ubiquinone/menaquinone biosynthesis C-methylase UbiE
MNESKGRYVPALGHAWLTSLYDPIVALTTRERTFKERLIRQAAIGARDRVLDLGCGTGTLALWVKETVEGARVAGVDGDEKVLSVARRKALRSGFKPRFDRGLAFSLPYQDGSFDRVLSSLFFHHLSREDKLWALQETFRVLRPGGELHVADWGRPASLLMRLLFTAVRILDGFENTRDNVEGLLPGLIEQAGFERVSLRGGIATVFGTLALYGARKPV